MLVIPTLLVFTSCQLQQLHCSHSKLRKGQRSSPSNFRTDISLAFEECRRVQCRLLQLGVIRRINRLGPDGPRPVQETVNSECYKQSAKQSATVRVINKVLQSVVQRCYSGCETAKDQRRTIAKWQQDKSPQLGVKAGTSLTS